MARRVAALSLFPLITLFHLLACTETSGETPSIPQEEPQGDPPYATLVLEATYPDGFSYLSGIRELSDGTVMVADPLAQLLLRLDMDAGSSESLCRVGGGPDSVAAVRFDRATETSDTVASIWVPERQTRRMGSRSRVLATVLEPRDEWAIGRDRAVAVVRANGYRVDAFDGDGLRLGYVELPLGCRLLGFGAGPLGERTAYLVRTDEVGLKWLERYRVVSSPGPDHSVDF